jgi:integrase
MKGYLVKKKNHYYAVIYEGTHPATGKEVRRYHPAGTVRRDAERLLTQLVRSVHDGEYVKPERATFGEYLTAWITAQQSQLKSSTWASYKATIDKHIVPALGAIKLQALTPEHLDAFYAERLASGWRGARGGALSPKTVRNMHVVIHSALADAVRKRAITRNVATLADPPKLKRGKKPTEIRYWTAEQLRAFLDENARHRFWPAWYLAAFTGLRRGELLGLRWRDLDLDLDAKRLSVRQTLLSVEHRLEFSSGKTDNAERAVDLDDRTIAVLRAHRKAQAAERLLIGGLYDDHELVFAHPDGRPVHPDVFSQTFERRVKASQLPRIRLHDLRHTHASLLIAAGVPVKVVSERLGHANTAFTTSVYQHVMPGMQSAAAETAGALVFGS